MNRRTVLGVATLTLLGMGVGVGWFAWSTSSPTPVKQTRSALPPARPTARVDPETSQRTLGSTRSWKPGLRYSYALELEQKLWLQSPNAGPSAGQPPNLRVALTGELTTTVVDEQAGEHYVEYSLQPARFTMDGSQSPPHPQAQSVVQAALGQAFYVGYSDRGAALDIYTRPGTDPNAQAFMRTLISVLQVVIDGTPSARWTSQELDPTGSFEAIYEQVGTVDFDKTRTRYLLQSTPQGLAPLANGVAIEPSGKLRLSLDDRLWLRALHGKDRIRVGTAASISAIGEVEVDCRSIGSGTDSLRVGAFQTARGQLERTGLGVLTQTQPSEEDRLRQIVKGATLSSLVEALTSLPDDETVRGPATAQMMQQLIALFRLEPDKASDVPALLRTARERSVYSSLIGSLSAASTAESVEALAKISGDEAQAQAVRVDAIAGLGTAEKPTDAGLQRLLELAEHPQQELRDTATLALGNTERSLRANGDAGADRALQRILDKATHSLTDSEQALGLSALGNTASADALPAIEKALSSDSVEVRASAAGALRLIPDPRAVDLLLKALNDPSPDVRRRAVFASSFRPIAPLLPGLSRIVSADPVDAVRMDAVRVLGENRNRVPEVIPLLESVRQRDSNPDIRAAAARFLEATRG